MQLLFVISPYQPGIRLVLSSIGTEGNLTASADSGSKGFRQGRELSSGGKALSEASRAF